MVRCYNESTSSLGIIQGSQDTVMVPVTTMEDLTLLTEAERAEMLQSLEVSEAEIRASRFFAHDPATFVERLTALRDKAWHAKTV